MSNTEVSRLEHAVGAARPYRADIDGLRAVAVLSVIFHHYWVPGFGGGFVGVDVFFVISGFLIAEHIDSDLGKGRFSLLAFYERRIRRILPAFFLMYALTLLAICVIQIPRDLHSTLVMAVRVIPFLANVAFFRNAGEYGGEFASHIPLLHTWSLAVEEQFYLVFPLLMLAISRGTVRSRVTFLAILSLLSFAACVVVVRAVPSAAFYLTPYRAWELLAGALLAVTRLPAPRDPRVRGGIAASGLLLILTADFFFSYAIPHPSELTLLPCAGALAIIYAGADSTTAAGRVLGNPLMRRIGWWSYSLYLYHWPLLVLTKYCSLDPLSAATRALLIALTFLLGWLSWRYVEQPFRRPTALLGRPAVYVLASAVGAVLMMATLVARHFTDPIRFSEQQRTQSAADTLVEVRCRNTSPGNSDRPTCKLGDPAAPVDAVLWGDSHALALLPAFDAAYARHHQAMMLAQHGGCPALLHVFVDNTFPAESDLLVSWLDSLGWWRGGRCFRDTSSTLDWIIQQHIGTVILAGHWTAYTEGHLGVRLTDSESPHNYSLRDNAEVFSRGLGRLLATLDRAGIRVFIVDDAPEIPVDLPYALAVAQRFGVHRDFRISLAEYDQQQHSATDIFARLQQRYGFRILRPQDSLCAEGLCAVTRNDMPLYFDEEHLSPLGALVAAPALEAIWNNPPAR